MAGMSSAATGHHHGPSHSQAHNHRAHRCSFQPDRQDLYLRLGTVTVFVRDQERSLRFYLDQLGFEVAVDERLPSGDRMLTVGPPDGTAILTLACPKPGSDEHQLIGRPTQIAFLTENVSRKYEQWCQRGVLFPQPPQPQSWGGMVASFVDVDGNSFALVDDESAREEIEEQRRAHVEKAETERLVALELENAREVQARLFPQEQPKLATLECAGLCVQARTIGGDYYDFLDLGRDRFGLVIGDVAGKGTAAALLMANLQAHLRNLCSSYSSRPYVPLVMEQPQRLLQAVNRLFCENTADRAFATLLFAEYDDATRRLRYANCGHLPALLFRGDHVIERLDPTSTVVGLFRNWECSVGEKQLAAGDTLLFYTDGVTESFNHADEEFGEERLIEAVRQRRELSSSALLRSLVEEVRLFSTDKQHDDITLIAAKCH
jgi:serine phosphatase RsbU (regulator of sigma subunit)/predicted enzyme related to lactoylglutathione lyase